MHPPPPSTLPSPGALAPEATAPPPALWSLAAEALRRRFGPPPEAAVVLGSGMSGLADRLTDREGDVPYGALGLPATGVAGHAGTLSVGTLSGVRLALLAGRVHLYEGRPVEESLRHVRALGAWGVRRLLLTSAVGGIRDDLSPGLLVRITDHINLIGRNPLVGPNEAAQGERFFDLTDAYSPRLAAVLDDAARHAGVTLKSGVYAAVSGPTYETPAEIRMLALLGADVVGMSLIPEVMAGRHQGMEVAAVAVISNRAAGLSAERLTHEDVQLVVGRAADQMTQLLKETVIRW